MCVLNRHWNQRTQWRVALPFEYIWTAYAHTIKISTCIAHKLIKNSYSSMHQSMPTYELFAQGYCPQKRLYMMLHRTLINERFDFIHVQHTRTSCSFKADQHGTVPFCILYIYIYTCSINIKISANRSESCEMMVIWGIFEHHLDIQSVTISGCIEYQAITHSNWSMHQYRRTFCLCKADHNDIVPYIYIQSTLKWLQMRIEPCSIVIAGIF